MQKLLETIRIESFEDQIRVFDVKEHIDRLFNSIELLSLGSQPLNLAALIKNKIQEYFSTEKIFFEETIFDNESKVLYKAKILYSANNIDISIDPYIREKPWGFKILSPKEFQINSGDNIHGHKYYPRPDLSQFLSSASEIIWTNELDYICEGSFTNVFFQDQLGDWHTPSLENNILPGIMRAKLIPVLNAKEGFYRIEDLQSAKEIRLTNSMIKSKIVNLI